MAIGRVASARTFDGLSAAFCAILLLGSGLTGCAPSNDRLDAPPAALRVVGPWDLGGLDPKVAWMFTRTEMIEPLLGADDSGAPLPGLAERWSASEDGLTWTFILRKGVTFHDGSALTAQQAAWVLQRARVAPGALALAPVSDIAAEGDAVVIRLTRPFAPLPALLAHSSTSIMARSAYDADGKDVIRIVGTGPYKMVSFDPPLRMELAYFPGWRGPAPEVRNIVYQSVTRIEARTLMAQSRQADLVYSIDAPAAKRILADPLNRVLDVTMPRTLILNLNAAVPGLDDVRVRRAISLALDRKGIAAGVLRDGDLAATQLFAPGLPGWHSARVEPLRHDLAAARALLASAGWTLDPDGVAGRNGRKLSFSLLTYSDRSELPVMAAVVQEELRQIGVAIDVQIGNSSDIPLAHRDGSLQMALSARNYAYLTEPTPTVLQDYRSGGGDWGATNWSSPVVDQALDQLQLTLDPGRQRALRETVAEQLQAGLPVIPVAWYRERVAISDRIKDGVSMDPLERTFRIGQIRWRRPAGGATP